MEACLHRGIKNTKGKLRFLISQLWVCIFFFSSEFWDINLQLRVIKSEFRDINSQFLEIVTMQEKSELRDITANARKKHIAVIFSQNCEIYLQLQVIKSNSEEKKSAHDSDIFSQSELQDKSHNCEKMSELRVYIFLLTVMMLWLIESSKEHYLKYYFFVTM